MRINLTHFCRFGRGAKHQLHLTARLRRFAHEVVDRRSDAYLPRLRQYGLEIVDGGEGAGRSHSKLLVHRFGHWEDFYDLLAVGRGGRKVAASMADQLADRVQL